MAISSVMASSVAAGASVMASVMGASVAAGASVAGEPQAVSKTAATTVSANICHNTFFILLSLEKW